jgi:hypothetical protein
LLVRVSPVAAVPGRADFEAWPWQGFGLPAKTPNAVIVKLHDTYVAAIADPVVRQKVSDAGAELLQSSPQAMADHTKSLKPPLKSPPTLVPLRMPPKLPIVPARRSCEPPGPDAPYFACASRKSSASLSRFW